MAKWAIWEYRFYLKYAFPHNFHPFFSKGMGKMLQLKGETKGKDNVNKLKIKVKK